MQCQVSDTDTAGWITLEVINYPCESSFEDERSFSLYRGSAPDVAKPRRLSRLELSLDAGVSQLHRVRTLTPEPPDHFAARRTVEGAASRVNAMLVASGFAPEFAETRLSSPDVKHTREMVDRFLHALHPHPALALDSGWNILAMNRTVGTLTEDVDPLVLEGEVNALRLPFHPRGPASRIVNFHDWRDYLLLRLSHDIDFSGDNRLIELLEELESCPVPLRRNMSPKPAVPAFAIPLIVDSRYPIS